MLICLALMFALCGSVLSLESKESYTLNHIPQTYKLTQEEIQALLMKKADSIQPEPWLLSTGSKPNPFVFTKDTFFPNTRAMCIDNDVDGETFSYMYRFQKARCGEMRADRRTFLLTCKATRRTERSFEKLTNLVQLKECPEDYVCQDWDYGGPAGVTIEDVQCVDESDVEIEWIHTAEAVHGSPTTGLLHCAADQSIPSTSYPMAPTNGFNVGLSESVSWPNGSAYHAPELRIHDKTNTFGFDRVYKRGASEASALIHIDSVHGYSTQRTIQFCVKLLPSRRDFFVMFVHSWWKAPPGIGRASEFYA